MAFVNEYIPKDDFVTFGLHAVDNTLSPDGLPSAHTFRRDWTIDRERNIYLREFSVGRDIEESNQEGWTFYWKGELLWFRKEVLETHGKRNAPQRTRLRISHLHIPPHLKCHQSEILDDIRSAFTTYAGGGVFSNATEYSVEIEFDLS